MENYSLDIQSQTDKIPTVISSVKSILNLQNPKKLNQIELSIQEALCNAIKHGNGNDSKKHIKIQYYILDEFLHVIVEDEGIGVPTQSAKKELKDINSQTVFDESGRGIMLMKHFCDEVKFDKNRVELILSLKE